MKLWQHLKRPPWRTIIPGCCLPLILSIGYLLWRPGLDIRDGRSDRGHNGIWLSHGWLGGDAWFIANKKTGEFAHYRNREKINELAERLRRHHITDLFPHLCPAEPDGKLPPIDPVQVEHFLDAFEGFRVIPWIGGPNGSSARLHRPEWRVGFATAAKKLLLEHPRLAGVQINIEPLTSGDTNFLNFLEEFRIALPKGKLISVAAYPPPTWWHPYEEVHWRERYFREVARRCDQLAVMMYDAGQRNPKTYQHLMADWTREVLAWSEGTPVLLGLPTYDDTGVGYHNPEVENLRNALMGIHRGLWRTKLSTNYQGVAIYCDWETSENEWSYFRKHFLNQTVPLK